MQNSSKIICRFDRLQGGKIKDSRLIMDALGLMMQLGVFPPPKA